MKRTIVEFPHERRLKRKFARWKCCKSDIITRCCDKSLTFILINAESSFRKFTFLNFQKSVDYLSNRNKISRNEQNVFGFHEYIEIISLENRHLVTVIRTCSVCVIEYDLVKLLILKYLQRISRIRLSKHTMYIFVLHMLHLIINLNFNL